MALTINWKGLGVIANCDIGAGTSDSAGGTWSNTGGGTTMAGNPDVYIFGTESIGCKYANKDGNVIYDYGSGINFSTTYANNLVYVWLNIQSVGQFDTLANKGITFRMSSSSSTLAANYKEFHLAADGAANGWNGGWKLFVFDPTLGNETGTLDLTSVRYFGITINSDTSVRADSIFIDQIAVGEGLSVTGSSTTGWLDVVNYCTDLPNRAWGIFQEREGIYYCYGKVFIGDSTQTANTSFKDSGRVIQWGETEYHNGTAWVTSVKSDDFGIVLDDAAGFYTEFEDGISVGSDNGRSGSTFIGNNNEEVVFDGSSLTHASSFIKLYNTKFDNFVGGVKLFNDTGSLAYGITITNSGQFDPVGAPVLRNCIFSGTTDEYTTNQNDGAALLWNSNIDIESCQFIANTDATYNPHAIQHDASGSFTYTGLTFSGNDKDILFTAATGDLNISAESGTNVSLTNHTDLSTGSISVTNNVTITLTNIKPNTEVRVITSGTNTQVGGEEIVGGARGTVISFDNTGVVTSSNAGIADFSVFNNGDQIKIVGSTSNDGTYTIDTADSSTQITLTTATTTESASALISVYQNFDVDFNYTYSYSPDTKVDFVIHNLAYIYQRVDNVVLPSAASSIPIQQQIDRTYKNPA